ncbi:hypothetical protein RCC89_10145 [Cytophagaceae bacterium ABcell3]|nr:hypothetical protein RCC89_10145 [Cytophagaceae bacterium ABcell3]
MSNNKGYIIVGWILLTLYLGQHLLDIRWEYLESLQTGEMFNRWTGLALGIYILSQWFLTPVRLNKMLEKNNQLFTTIHKWMGAIAPLVFYIHTMYLGYAYLFFLSITFFSNYALGLLNPEVIKTKANWYLQGWMIAHVAFSLLISMLMIYHVWMVFYYE